MSTPAAPSAPTLPEPVDCCVCCDFDTLYAGKTITVTQVQNYQGGSGFSWTTTFTGTYTGGGTFSGTLTYTYNGCDYSGDGCGDRGSCAEYDSGSLPTTVTVSCGLVSGVPVYGLSNPSGHLGNPASFYGATNCIPGTGIPGCQGGNTSWEYCNRAYSGDCLSQYGHQEQCYNEYNSAPCVDFDRNYWGDITITVSIA